MTMQSGAIVVTGAAGGMGVAIARELADTGTLVLADLRATELERAKTLLGSSLVSARIVVCDVTSEPDVSNLAAVVAELGGLRALVHTAGVSPKTSPAM